MHVGKCEATGRGGSYTSSNGRPLSRAGMCNVNTLSGGQPCACNTTPCIPQGIALVRMIRAAQSVPFRVMTWNGPLLHDSDRMPEVAETSVALENKTLPPPRLRTLSASTEKLALIFWLLLTCTVNVQTSGAVLQKAALHAVFESGGGIAVWASTDCCS